MLPKRCQLLGRDGAVIVGVCVGEGLECDLRLVRDEAVEEERSLFTSENVRLIPTKLLMF